mgnify:FL=1|jgi:orotate phosphoribosyltransferase|tara:strand:+ start:2429 stop:2953 length:525 start_codon:yes stop_codon:yes gene_type:complete
MKGELLCLLKTYCYRKGEFTLSSGKTSEHYVNCKPVSLSGVGLNIISQLFTQELSPSTLAVGGLTLGADPLVAGVAMTAGVDGLIVRKEPKGHGTQAWIEGPALPLNTEVTVLEDVITTGGSAIKAVEKLRDAGYTVSEIITIVDRQEDGEADIKMKDANIKLKSLFTIADLAK